MNTSCQEILLKRIKSFFSLTIIAGILLLPFSVTYADDSVASSTAATSSASIASPMAITVTSTDSTMATSTNESDLGDLLTASSTDQSITASSTSEDASSTSSFDIHSMLPETTAANATAESDGNSGSGPLNSEYMFSSAAAPTAVTIPALPAGTNQLVPALNVSALAIQPKLLMAPSDASSVTSITPPEIAPETFQVSASTTETSTSNALDASSTPNQAVAVYSTTPLITNSIVVPSETSTATDTDIEATSTIDVSSTADSSSESDSTASSTATTIDNASTSSNDSDSDNNPPASSIAPPIPTLEAQATTTTDVATSTDEI